MLAAAAATCPLHNAHVISQLHTAPPCPSNVPRRLPSSDHHTQGVEFCGWMQGAGSGVGGRQPASCCAASTSAAAHDATHAPWHKR
jgi:hypothetical protein